MPPKRVFIVPETITSYSTPSVYVFDCASTPKATEIIAFFDKLAPANDAHWGPQVMRTSLFVTHLFKFVDPLATKKARAVSRRELMEDWSAIYGSCPIWTLKEWGTWTCVAPMAVYPLRDATAIYIYRAMSDAYVDANTSAMVEVPLRELEEPDQPPPKKRKLATKTPRKRRRRTDAHEKK